MQVGLGIHDIHQKEVQKKFRQSVWLVKANQVQLFSIAWRMHPEMTAVPPNRFLLKSTESKRQLLAIIVGEPRFY